MPPTSEPGNPDTAPHIPVLASAVLELLGSHRGPAVMVDATTGAGGHAALMLERYPAMRLLGLDRDPDALAIARGRLATFGGRVQLVRSGFSDIRKAMTATGVERADIVLADLGVSSMQIDRAERGFSFSQDGPLDMRMEGTGESALDLLERLDERELADVIYQYGEERLSRRIAKSIKEALDSGELVTTTQLAEVCRRCYPKGKKGIHPATRTFQALRIAVNDELGELERLLKAAPGVLAKDGLFGVISFHSLEDRMVKRKFIEWKAEGRAEILTKKPAGADEEEVAKNPRARSAKLRVCRWI